jgi:hypothetical protein
MGIYVLFQVLPDELLRGPIRRSSSLEYRSISTRPRARRRSKGRSTAAFLRGGATRPSEMGVIDHGSHSPSRPTDEDDSRSSSLCQAHLLSDAISCILPTLQLAQHSCFGMLGRARDNATTHDQPAPTPGAGATYDLIFPIRDDHANHTMIGPMRSGSATLRAGFEVEGS